MAASAVTSTTFPVNTPAADISNVVPLVLTDAIFAVFEVVCSASISSEYPPAARSVLMNNPRPASACILRAVEPVALA